MSKYISRKIKFLLESVNNETVIIKTIINYHFSHELEDKLSEIIFCRLIHILSNISFYKPVSLPKSSYYYFTREFQRDRRHAVVSRDCGILNRKILEPALNC